MAAPAAAAPDDRLPAAAPEAAAPAGGGGGARDGSGFVAAALARRLGGAASLSVPPGATESPFAARVVAKRAYARTPRGTTGTSATAKGERRAQSAGARGAMRHGAAGVVHAAGIIAAQERPEREREPPLAGWRAVGCAGAAHGVRKEARAAVASSARAAQAGPARFCADASTQRASDPAACRAAASSARRCGRRGADAASCGHHALSGAQLGSRLALAPNARPPRRSRCRCGVATRWQSRWPLPLPPQAPAEPSRAALCRQHAPLPTLAQRAAAHRTTPTPSRTTRSTTAPWLTPSVRSAREAKACNARGG